MLASLSPLDNIRLPCETHRESQSRSHDSATHNDMAVMRVLSGLRHRPIFAGNNDLESDPGMMAERCCARFLRVLPIKRMQQSTGTNGMPKFCMPSTCRPISS